ncbi:MAG: low affinity iron permease family protein [Nitrospira sp.]
MEPHLSLGSQPSVFNRLANQCSRLLGTASAFGIAVALVLIWAISGPFFHFSDTWELVINTATTIVTFLMVFLIQNTQNRDSAAIQLKLDEIIRSTRGAHNAMLDLEKLSQKDLDKMRKLYEQLADEARRDVARSEAAMGTPLLHTGMVGALEVPLSKALTNGTKPSPTKLLS